MAISPEQRIELAFRLVQHANWEALRPEQVQVGIDNAHAAAREFVSFIANGFRVQVGNYFRLVENLTIEVPALARPDLAMLQSKYDWIDRIECDDSPTDALTLVLGTVLREGERWIDGAEYQHRLRGVPMLGYQQLVWLVDHQDEQLAFRALLNQICVDGPAVVVVDVTGDRQIPCLRVSGKRWYLSWLSFSDGLSKNGRVALSGK